MQAKDFSIFYLSGSASGPIVTSPVTFGGTQVASQAYAAADQVDSQQLTNMNATGILGLALPANSVIQQDMFVGQKNPNNTIDDATKTGSLLTGLWQGAASGSRYFGVGLKRLPSDGGNGDSTLTFGGVDTAFVPALESMKWSSAVADSDEVTRKWKLYVSDLVVTVNGTQVQIPLSSTGAQIPLAILDTGAPLNYASSEFLNAMYGAWNVGPAGDGSGGYYVDCKLQMEISILVGSAIIPIHPLDANLKQSSTSGAVASNSDGCIGAFQPFNSAGNQSDLPAEFVLGAPFLRSVYSAYSCDAILDNPVPGSQGGCVRPTVGLYPLYNTTDTYNQALSDFQKVRIQGQKLGDNSQIAGADDGPTGGFGTGAKIAVGVVVGLVGIVAIMVVLLLILKRRRAREEHLHGVDAGAGDQEEKDDLVHARGGSTLVGPYASEKERQEARQLAILHGHFVEDDVDPASLTPNNAGGQSTTASTSQAWDVDSAGYWEANAIRNQYRKKQQQHQDGRRSLATHGSQADTHFSSEEHELSESPLSALR